MSFEVAPEKKYKYNKIHPRLEIYRKELITFLFDKFYNVCTQFNPTFPKHKAIDFMTRFCWKNDGDVDPVIPYNTEHKYDKKQLRKDLNNYGFDDEQVMKKLKIGHTLLDLIEQVEKMYDKIDENDDIVIDHQDDRLVYERWNVECSNSMYRKLEKFYDGKFKNKDMLFFCILYRYSILGADNQQLSVNVDLKRELTTNFSVNYELFGSCFNRTYKTYNSIYYDVEKYFGSAGNFFNNTYIEGLYMANPPFDETIMENMSLKLIECLEKTSKPLGFIIFIPIWDFDTMKKISAICKTKFADMGKYDAYEILKASKYYHKHYIFCKNSFPYHNLKTGELVFASNTYIFILKNDKMNFNSRLFDSLVAKYRPMYL